MALAINQKANAHDFTYTYNGQTLYYNISGSEAIVTYPSDQWLQTSRPAGALVIPSTVVHESIVYNVTAIQGYALSHCTELSSVVIPGSIQSIGHGAFMYCTGLTSVSLSYGINNIGAYAFSGCTSLSSISIPGSVGLIEECAFLSCSGLTSITIADGVDSIASGAFAGCGVTSIEIPYSVKFVFGANEEGGAFSGCSNLISAIIRCHNTGNGTFSSCSSLNSVILGDSVVVIGQHSFDGCTSLSNITLPTSIDSICYYSFSSCNFTSIAIPASVSYMGDLGYMADYSTVDTVYMLGSVPPDVDPSMNMYNILTFVPCNSGLAYCESEFWRYNKIIDTCATLTVINNGGGSILGFDDIDYTEFEIEDTMVIQQTGQTGSYYLSFYSVTDPDIAMESQLQPKQLTHLYIDGVDCIEGGNPMLSIYVYDTAYSLILYQIETSIRYSQIIEAVFEDLEMFTVTVSTSDSTLGTVFGDGRYFPNSEITISAFAHVGTVFNGWSNGSMENPLTLTVTSDTTLIALFSSASASVTDTLWMHDTTTVVDTVTLTEYVPVHDTTYINVHDTSYIILTDTLTVTLYDTIINTVFDTIDNYIYDTTLVTDTLWLTQYDTIWLYDTIVVHDTIYITQEGIEGAETANAKIYQRDGHVVVEGVELQTVALYDAVGRVMAVKRNEGDAIRFDVPASGTYLVQVGNAPARRIVVVK